MNISYKTTLAFVAITLTLLTTPVMANEQLCLVNGRLAGVVSKLLADGATPERIKFLMTDTNASPKVQKKLARDADMIVDFVYTMQLGEADARKFVYMKCLIGEYK